ncbi:MAG: GNAT family N-acetyltransferase [Burkholderiales bacterium]|nr:GNAT family N-acetyltransferase [Burkholderiales bacterium]
MRFGAPVAQKMVAEAQAEITQRYGSEDENPVESVQFDPPEGVFLVAWIDGQPVGCGGWRTISHFSEDGGLAEDVAEIKRMYVAPSARNSGVATALLTALEESARESGMRRVVLETGLAQPEAIAFYTKMGYERVPNYGYYKDSPDCVSFGRDL